MQTKFLEQNYFRNAMRNTLIFKSLQKRFLTIFQLADYQAITNTPLNTIINSLNHKYLNYQKA